MSRAPPLRVVSPFGPSEKCRTGAAELAVTIGAQLAPAYGEPSGIVALSDPGSRSSLGRRGPTSYGTIVRPRSLLLYAGLLRAAGGVSSTAKHEARPTCPGIDHTGLRASTTYQPG